MESGKKLFSLMTLCLILGLSSGFYFGTKLGGSGKKVEINNQKADCPTETSDAGQKTLALQKLDLLKSYTDFVLLPKEKIADPVKYAEDMGELVKSINSEEITAKYYATGETEGKEQKIVDFLDYLSESLKADLR
jgi:hypothetical protein